MAKSQLNTPIQLKTPAKMANGFNFFNFFNFYYSIILLLLIYGNTGYLSNSGLRFSKKALPPSCASSIV